MLERLLHGRTVTGSNAISASDPTPSSVVASVNLGSSNTSKSQTYQPIEDENSSFFDNTNSDAESANEETHMVPKQLTFSPSDAKQRSAGTGSSGAKRHRPSAGLKLCGEVKLLNETLLNDSQALQAFLKQTQQRDFLEEALTLLQESAATEPEILSILLESVNILQDPLKAKTFVLLQPAFRLRWLASLVSNDTLFEL